MCMLFGGCSFSFENKNTINEKPEEARIEVQDMNDSCVKKDSHESVETKYVYKPVLIKKEESDDILATDDKFSAFFNYKNDKNVDIESFVEGYNESNLAERLYIIRNDSKDGYVEYSFSLENKEIFSVKNEIENSGLEVEYIQISDINEDGSDEILVAYYTRGTSTFSVNEFYVYGLYNNSWIQLMSYIYSKNDTNISKLLENSGYKKADIADVCISSQGLIVSVDEGEKIEGVYYPKGYRLFIK